MSLAEAPFQLVELRRREPRPVPLLLVGLAGVVAVGPAAPATRVNGGGGGGGRGGQPVAGRGQVETAARQPERSAAVAGGSGGGRRQL